MPGLTDTPKVHVFSIVWNEEYMLPYFLRHYSTFADTIFIINDHSTDKTAKIAKAHPKSQLLDFPYNRGLNEDDFSDCFADFYKQYSRGVADWVMCVDADELIYNADILGVLKQQRQRGVQVLKTTGYQMVAETPPTTIGQIYEECKVGGRSRGFDKPVVFDPELNITFGNGRHSVQVPEGIHVGRARLLLLHYKYLSRDFYINRSNIVYPRTSGMTDEIIGYRLKRALKWYDHVMQAPSELERVV